MNDRPNRAQQLPDLLPAENVGQRLGHPRVRQIFNHARIPSTLRYRKLIAAMYLRTQDGPTLRSRTRFSRNVFISSVPSCSATS